jgi:2-desacetyl-2-hydroxyethyl bacteriochlorophyllide A dehydrogenase
VAVGDRVLGCYQTACGTCWFCRRGLYHKCDHSRTFGHGELLGSLQGAQADQVLVPGANLCLRRVPDGMDPGVALFAGDVMGTGYHAVVESGTRPGDLVGVVGLGPVGLCAVLAAKAAGAARIFAVDSVPDRLDMARSFGAEALHLADDDPRGAVKRATGGRGLDVVVDAVGHPDALDLAVRLARKGGTVSATGVYAEKLELNMGLVWLKAVTLCTGHANVIAHVDPVLDLLASGVLDPTPLISRHMALEDAPEAYAAYDRREALKIVLEP